ncbi:MAG: restriction endonuclease subunit S [Nitrosomonas sp.]|nr:restriction endonuclease subunit S [Nitrosomonas sp.]MDP1951874.1 restriction endonuclease subunit S [Nitrosomonas sp.]
MSEWSSQPLADAIELIGGGTPKTSNPEFWNGDIPWLSVVDFNTGRKFVSDAEKKITQKGLDSSSTKLLNKGDIIISARGTVGAMAVLDKPMTFNQSCYGVRGIKGKSITDYIYYLLKEKIAELSQISHGGVFDTITRDTFKEINASLPPLPEQKAIASVLSSLDDKIDLLHRQNKTLEAMAETLFRQWFVEEAQGNWEAGTLGNVVDFNYGKTLKDQERSGSGYPVVGSSGVVGFHKDYLVEAPGIVTGRKGTLGVVNYFFDNFFPIDTTFYMTSKIQSDGLFYEYLLLKSVGLGDMNSDSAVPGLNRNAAHAIPVTIPPSELVSNFNNFCKPTFAKINTNTCQIRTLKTLRDTLLPKLMSGEVRVRA